MRSVSASCACARAPGGTPRRRARSTSSSMVSGSQKVPDASPSSCSRSRAIAAYRSSSRSRRRHPSIARRLATAVSQAPALWGTPSDGHCAAPRARLLGEVLGLPDVADEAGQGRHDPGGLDAPDGGEGAAGAVGVGLGLPLGTPGTTASSSAPAAPGASVAPMSALRARRLVLGLGAPAGLLLDLLVVRGKSSSSFTRRTSRSGAGAERAAFAHSTASSLLETPMIQKPLKSSLASAYGPSVTTGGVA